MRNIMAKRFTDSRKYQDPWFRHLNPRYKLIWDYVIHACDHAGIWKVDFDLASFCIGDTYTYEEVSTNLKDKVVMLSKNKWFIPKFIEFQYETLNPENRVHNSVINILTKSGVNKPLISTLQGCKDYNKDKDKDKYSETDIQTFFNYYLLKTGKKFKLNDTRKKLIQTRLKDYSIDDMKRAIDNFMADTWEGRKDHLDLVYCIGVRNKIDNLEKWLNKGTGRTFC